MQAGLCCARRVSTAIVLLAVGGVKLCAPGLSCRPAAAAEALSAASAAAAVVTVEINGGKRLGSGLVVGETGLVATSFSLASSGKRARVVFGNGAGFDVAGYVAVRKGKDLVVLSLRKPPRELVPLKLADRVCDVGAPCVLHAGPRGAPYLFTTTKVLSVRTGDCVVAGWSLPRPEIGIDADTVWMTADSFMPESGLGGAMLEPDGTLLGMLAFNPEHADRVHAAVHADHIARLLERVQLPPKPLASLKRYDDLPAASVPADVAKPLVRSGVSERAESPADWFAGLRRRIVAAEGEVPTFRPREDEIRAATKDLIGREQELTKKLAAVEDTRAAIRPEQPVERRITRMIDVPNGEGRTRRATETIRTTEFVLSDRQKQQVGALDLQAAEARARIAALKVEIRLNEFRTDQVADDMAAAKRRAAAHWSELFLAADPLELRRPDDTRVLLGELTKITDTLGTTSPVLVIKSLLHLRLREFPECEQWADQAVDVDKSAGPVVQALRARCAFLQGQESAAASLMNRIGKKGADDVRLVLMQVRLELDRANHVAALRHARAAAERGADPTEMDLVLGLMYSTSPQKSAGDAQKALLHAGRACESTRWKDWRGLVALAAANAASREFDAAARALDAAAVAAPPGYDDDFARWRASLKGEEPLKYRWK